MKIGMIGLDTSHVSAFTKLLNDPSNEFKVEGGEVTCAFPGGSFDMKPSYSRLEGFTTELRDVFNVDIVNSCEEVAENSDCILLESVDGRIHLEQFKKIAPFSKPVFIDKPFTTSVNDAQEIVKLAEKFNVPLMSSSALRFAEGYTTVLAKRSKDSIKGVDCFGPMAIEPTQKGLFWYGIHTVDMLYVALGTGCVEVTATTEENYDVVVGRWEDGRLGLVRGNRTGNRQFGALVHYEDTTEYADAKSSKKPYYASLLEQIMGMFQTGKAPIDPQETVEVVRFIEAANESRETGKSVKL